MNMETSKINPNSLHVLPGTNGHNPHVALVGPEIEENLSLRYLASSLSAAGFTSQIIPFNSSKDMGRILNTLIKDISPKMVAISLAFQWRAMDFIGLAIALREHGYKGHITAGGHFGTFQSNEILKDFPEIDSICIHEAEETLVKLTHAIISKTPLDSIKGLAIRTTSSEIINTEKHIPPDIATLPWPDRRGNAEQFLGNGIAMLVSSRGCYANCTFCCISAWHKKASAGKRYRYRPIDDVADEMVWLNKNKDITIFIFHDDNFFLPSTKQSLDKINRLADALEHRGIGKFTTVVKARPNDIDHDVCRAMKERLGLIRIFLGIETDSHQGLKTLGRNIISPQNHETMDILNAFDVYVCYNMLIFDPDTTVESLETNLNFMEKYAHTPFNFCRVELYSGTPLLERMLNEGRCRGDYMGWDYTLHDNEIQKIFQLTMKAFQERNFSEGAIAYKIMGTRFFVDTCRYFFPEYYDEKWMRQVKDINKRLVFNTTGGIREIIDFVRSDNKEEFDFIKGLTHRLHLYNETCREETDEFEERVTAAVAPHLQQVL